MAAKERALDIFQLLGQIDAKNYGIWDTLTPEQQKEFSPLVTMRWMSSCNDPFQLIMLNEIVNPTVFNLPDHKEFLLKLLTVCSNGKNKRYGWVNYKAGGTKKAKMSVQLIAEHYNMSLVEASDSVRLFSAAEIFELGEMHGLQKDELKNLKKELEA